jgi:hypothetical protein
LEAPRVEIVVLVVRKDERRPATSRIRSYPRGWQRSPAISADVEDLTDADLVIGMCREEHQSMV